ncbi:MAG: glutamine--fructose-6-phosphate transaminase (isomerizing) [Candidatus Nealsonbacteria bacterium]|nr:glutamine--fructose-6-phosphate transaminase (isomerizing) [Candidatus Nealsonbacteria bacterium]
MCGIVGYIGKQDNIKIGLTALKRLEYRGYDSAGFAVFNEEKNKIFCLKRTGRVDVLENEIKNSNFSSDLTGSPSIFHTRWATHGQVSDANAHPHSDCQENIFLAHNGIIENYKELKEILEKEGHKFKSETDTEVIAHLIEKNFKGNLEIAVRKAVKNLKGAYALVVISRDDPKKIVAARLSSPLVIGIPEDNSNEYLIASDQTAIVPFTKKIINLEDNEVVVIGQDNFLIIKEREPERLEIDADDIQKDGYPHFMLKEIMESPEAVDNSIKGRLIPEEGLAMLGGLQDIEKELRKIKRLNIVGCGTASYAAMVGRYMLEEYAGIPTEVDISSEFRYRKPILDEATALLCISQSGETADTLAALREIKRRGTMTLGIVNVPGSTMTRETDAGIYNHIGPEIGVAATKSFVSQLVILALFTLFLGRQRGLSLVKGQRIVQDIQGLSGKMREFLGKQNGSIKELAEKYSKFNNFIYLGRKYNYPIALEGALKLKEIAYPIHAEGFASGEMKHGPLALADPNFPFVFIAPQDSVYEKNLSNMEEVKARKAPIIAIATEGDERIRELADDVIYIPKTSEMLTPILSVLPLQLFAYHMGVLRGCDVDKPRNLAKSVTVE